MYYIYIFIYIYIRMETFECNVVVNYNVKRCMSARKLGKKHL